jgi:hypothetical protein
VKLHAVITVSNPYPLFVDRKGHVWLKHIPIQSLFFLGSVWFEVFGGEGRGGEVREYFKFWRSNLLFYS